MEWLVIFVTVALYSMVVTCLAPAIEHPAKKEGVLKQGCCSCLCVCVCVCVCVAHEAFHVSDHQFKSDIGGERIPFEMGKSKVKLETLHLIW